MLEPAAPRDGEPAAPRFIQEERCVCLCGGGMRKRRKRKMQPPAAEDRALLPAALPGSKARRQRLLIHDGRPNQTGFWFFGFNQDPPEPALITMVTMGSDQNPTENLEEQ